MIGHTWVGADGAVFDLTRTDGGVWLNTDGVEGVGTPPLVDFIRDSPFQDGQTLTGWRAAPREIVWPVVIDGGGSWAALQRSFFGTLRPGVYGRWQVTSPTGEVRELRCRFVSEDGVYTVDPSIRGLEVRSLSLVADDPFWAGVPFAASFSNGSAPTNFFGPTGFGPPFYIGDANTAATATVTNDGDVDSWPKYVVDGPMSSFSVGIGGKYVAASYTVPSGAQLVVDTHPNSQQFWLHNGGTSTQVPLTAFTSFDFARVPAGGTVQLDVEIVGAGTLTVVGDTKFYRAW